MNHECYCGSWAVEKTSWTEYNPGRKFRTCSTSSCDFFKWSEPEVEPRSKSVINGLLRRYKLKDDEHFAELIAAKNNYEEEMRQTKKEVKIWKFMCIMLVLYIVHGMVNSVEKNEGKLNVNG